MVAVSKKLPVFFVVLLLFGCASPKYVQLKHEATKGDNIGEGAIVYITVADNRVKKDKIGSQGKVRPDKPGDWVILNENQNLENFFGVAIKANLLQLGFDARYRAPSTGDKKGIIMEVSINKCWVVKYEEFVVAHMNSEMDISVVIRDADTKKELSSFDVVNGDFVAQHPFQDDEETYEESLDKTFDGLMAKLKTEVEKPAFLASFIR